MSQGKLKVKGRRSEKKAIQRAWHRLSQVAQRLDREEGRMTTRGRCQGVAGGRARPLLLWPQPATGLSAADGSPEEGRKMGKKPMNWVWEARQWKKIEKGVGGRQET